MGMGEFFYSVVALVYIQWKSNLVRFLAVLYMSYHEYQMSWMPSI